MILLAKLNSKLNYISKQGLKIHQSKRFMMLARTKTKTSTENTTFLDTDKPQESLPQNKAPEIQNANPPVIEEIKPVVEEHMQEEHPQNTEEKTLVVNQEVIPPSAQPHVRFAESTAQGCDNHILREIAERMQSNKNPSAKNYLEEMQKELDELQAKNKELYQQAVKHPEQLLANNLEHPLAQTLYTSIQTAAAVTSEINECVGRAVEINEGVKKKAEESVALYNKLLKRIENFNPWSFKFIAMSTGTSILLFYTAKFLITGQVPLLPVNAISSAQWLFGLTPKTVEPTKEKVVVAKELAKEVFNNHPMALGTIIVGSLAVLGIACVALGSQRLALKSISLLTKFKK